MKWRIGFCVLALTLFLSVDAGARVAAHGAQKSPIVNAVGFGNQSSPPPLKCEDVWISSRSRFWAIEYYGGQEHGPCLRYGSDGAAFLHHVRGRWQIVVESSGFICPKPFHLRGVPYSIERDLLGCH